jgi:uncharacterized protein (DUF58 family)
MSIAPGDITIPKNYELRRIQIRSRRLITGDLLGQYRSAFRGTGLVYTEIREYQPGDDVKHIHWKATARTGTVFVKSYEEDRQLRVMLAVDASASMRAPFSHHAFSKALEFSSLVGALTQRGNDLLGVSLFAQENLGFLPPRSGLKRYNQILAMLLSNASPPTGSNLGGALEHLSTTIHKPSIIFVISDFFVPPFEEQLTQLGMRHDVVLVHIQPDLAALPNAGLVSFRDAETGELVAVDSSSSKVRRHWQKIIDLQRDELSEVARRCRVDHIVVRDSASQPLVRLMQTRAIKRKR